MSQKEPKVFTLSEANELIPQIVECTSKVLQRLDQIRKRYSPASKEADPTIPDWVMKEVEAALMDWSDRVMNLGVFPKGYFTVDFQSMDPEVLYCWSYGEEKIAYTHKVWENFSHRRPLPFSMEGPTDHLKWVN